MSLFRKRSLIFASIFLAALSGCRQTSFMPVGMVELPEVHFPVSEGVEKMTFKMGLQAKNSIFSGILVIKRMPSQTRLAFFSEVGMGYFEASMEGEYPYPIHLRSINPLISSPKTLENLQAAMNLLLVVKKDLKEGGVFRDKAQKHWIRGLATDGSEYWGRLDEDGQVDQAFLSGHHDLQANFKYSSEPAGFPELVHYKDKKENIVILLERIP
jgi:hypothetical protein